MCNGECLIDFGRSRRQAAVGLYACSFLLWLQLFQQCFSSRRKLRLFPFNSKKATAAIPNAVQELTSLSILGHEFFASKKHRYSLEPAASVPLLSVHPCTLLNDKFLLSTATEGRRIEQKRCLPLQTRKSIYNMDVVN